LIWLLLLKGKDFCSARVTIDFWRLKAFAFCSLRGSRRLEMQGEADAGGQPTVVLKEIMVSFFETTALTASSPQY